MLRVLADDANDTFSLDHLTLIADGLNRCSNFHDYVASLPIAIQNATSGEVIGRELDENSVTWQDFDVVHPDLARDMSQNLVPILQLYLEHGIGQVLDNRPLNFNTLLLFGLIRRRRR